MRLTFSLIAALLLTASANAQSVDTPQCRADLAQAGALINEIAGRDRAGPITDHGRLCATLRLNLQQMREAREIMQRCLRGHAQRENVGQMDVSMEDVATVIQSRCRSL